MAVAKSYEHMTICGEPYLNDKGRMYVKVTGKCPRCGGTGIWSYGPYGGTCFKCGGSGKETLAVRWYSDEERAKQDEKSDKARQAREQRAQEREEYKKGAEANNFPKGYTIAVLGETYSIKDELKAAGAKFIKGLGWTFAEWGMVPEQYTDRVRMIEWADASDAEGHIRPTEELALLVEVPSVSEYQFNPGQRVRGLSLTCVAARTYAYGYINTFEDEDKNVFVWMTSTKFLEPGVTYKMDVTIKEHQEYKGIKQTYLSRPNFKEAA